MKLNTSKGPDLQELRQYNTNRIIRNEDLHAVPLNVKLVSNPFLKDQ